MAKLRWNNFNAGLALSSRIGAEGSYRYGVGVMVDNPPGFVVDSGTLQEDTQTVLSQRDQAFGVAHRLMCTSSHLGITGIQQISGDYEYEDTSSDPTAVHGMVALIDTNSNRALYFLYETSSAPNVGKVEFKNNANWELSADPAKQHPKWLTDQIGSTVSQATGIYSGSQRLYLGGGRRVHYYDGNTGVFSKNKLDLPYNFQKFSEYSKYIAIFTDSYVYLWDGSSPSWNYSVSLDGNFKDAVKWRGGLYALVNVDGDVYLKKLNRSITAMQSVLKLPVDLNELGIGGENNYLDYDLKMTTGLDGIYITGVFNNCYVFRYGGRYPEMETVLTVQLSENDATSWDNVDDVHIPNIPFDPNFAFNDRIYILLEDGGTQSVYYASLDTKEGGISTFETVEQEVPEDEQGYSVGIAKNILIYPRADSTDTTVKLKADAKNNTADSNLHTLASNTSLTAGEVKKISAKGIKFKNAAIRLENTIPEVYRIELEYDVKRQV